MRAKKPSRQSEVDAFISGADDQAINSIKPIELENAWDDENLSDKNDQVFNMRFSERENVMIDAWVKQKQEAVGDLATISKHAALKSSVMNQIKKDLGIS